MWTGVIMVRLRILRLEGGNDKRDRHGSQINPSAARFVIYVCVCTREFTRVCIRQSSRGRFYIYECAAAI